MHFTRLAFQNYKPFKTRQEMELRPLTILIGKNNSGKSAASRLPVLLSGCLTKDADQPIGLLYPEYGLEFGASYADLVHNRLTLGSLNFAADLEFGGRSLHFEAEIKYFDKERLQVITDYSVNMDNFSMKLELVEPDFETLYHEYNVSGVYNYKQKIMFRGLIPEASFTVSFSNDIPSKPEGYDDKWREIVGIFHKLNNETKYFGPLREAPRRSYNYAHRNRHHANFRSSQAPYLLAMPQQAALLKKVGDWFAEHMKGWRLDVLPISEESFQLVLYSPHKSQTWVNLVDAGYGMGQVLPLVVDLLSETDPCGFTVVEEPELHLHPAALAPLADLYVDAVLRERRFLIETHSENYLLRLRRRVAEGKLKPEQIIIYWVDEEPEKGSHLKPIRIDSDGNVSYWPSHVFSEEMDDVGAIYKEQRKRQDTE